MRKYLLLPFVLFALTLQAQKKLSEEELEKMAANAEKMMKDPRYLKAMEEEGENNETISFPAKNPSMMATVPSQPLYKAAMSSYLSNLYTAYKTKMPIGAVAAAQQAGISLGNDPDKLAAAAVSTWYNGAPKEAILMGIVAGIKKPDDPLLLNNLAALLNMGGAPYHSLPILKTLVSQYPNNPMILNNIGQAFTGAGELDTAMYYFKRCIQESPHHPEANNTAGQIEQSRGNTEAAAQYFENSLKGGFNEGALKGIEKMGNGKSFNLSKHIKAPVDLPYFNEFKYKLPRQCQTGAEAPMIRQEHEDFINFIEAQSTMYHALAISESKEGSEKLEKMMHTALRNMTVPNMPSPVVLAAAKRMLYIGIGMQTEILDHEERMKVKEAAVQNLVQQYETQRQAILNDYAQRMAQYNCGEGKGADCAAIMRLQKEQCNAVVALGAAMQPQISAAVSDKQQEALRFARRKFHLFGYYGYLQSPNKQIANGEFYRACTQYLDELVRIVGQPIIVAGICAEESKVPSKSESDKVKTMECPIDLSIPFVVGKIELNCEKFTFTAGEGLKFKYEKDFGSKQSTISIGAGLQFEVGKAFGIFSGEVGASAEQSFYIVFDGDNSITDVGLAMEVEMSAGAEAGIDTPGEIGKEYLTKEILDQKASFGYTLGVNSGWTFNDGAISSLSRAIGNVLKK